MKQRQPKQTTQDDARANREARLVDLRWGDVAKRSRDTPVIFPIAALEQHGPHLPLFTDSMLTEEIVRRAAGRIGGRAIFAPVLWLGNSDHHLDFPGTLSAAPRTYLAVLNDLAENFLRHGFRRLVFFNGHGGNDIPARQAMFEVRQRHRQREDLLLIVATYWQLADPARLEKLGLRQGQMAHACEWETSMILRLAPHLVGDFRRIRPVKTTGTFASGTRAWVTQDRTKAGHLGYPHEASAAKGEALLRIFAEGLVGLLERMIAWDGRSW